MLANSRLLVFSVVLLIASLSNAQASEPGQDQELKGPPELEQRRVQHSQSDQVVNDNSGGEFMEEVPVKKARIEKPTQPIKIDLQNVGVSVDSEGKIIPQLNRGGPAVVPFSTQFEQSFQPVAPYGYGYGGYGGNPYAFNSYGMNPYGFGPYPARGYQPFGPLVQRTYTSQQQTIFFGPSAPWFAPPAPPSNSQSPNHSAVNPFF